MNLKNLYADDSAVSPVIGVILMVAITVILAAVIGTFVLGLGDSMNQNAPTTNFAFEEDGDKVTIEHTGGDSIPAGQITIDCGVEGVSAGDWEPEEDTLTAGSTNACNYDSESDQSGTIKINWESADGSTSQTLKEYNFDVSDA